MNNQTTKSAKQNTKTGKRQAKQNGKPNGKQNDKNSTNAEKIKLASSRDIPFNKLMLSQANVRRIKAGISIEELAQSIARRGLIQSLNVRPVLDDDGKETGMYEVPAGGRRFRALELLVKEKRLSKTAPVPCIVNDVDHEASIDEVSLAENIERAPLHPLDQFRAFVAMRDKEQGQGMSEEEIAAAFFVPVKVVKQRLRLASVSPTLLEVYANDEMTLEQLMAFTVSEDHERQEQVWQAICNNWQNEPWHIRRMLNENTVRASDKRAVFVGLEAYEAAGGIVVHDLFEEDNGGILQDVGLLDRLTLEKLKLLADQISEEGWKWVETALSFPYGVTHGMREIEGMPVDLSEEELAAKSSLEAEYARLNEEYSSCDELPDEIDQRLGEIEQALEGFDNRPMDYDKEEVAIAGVFVSIASDGRLLVDRGYVKPEDEPKADPVVGQTGDECFDGDGSGSASMHGNHDSSTADQSVYHGDNAGHGSIAASANGQVATGDIEEDGIKPLPDRLVSELTAHRTLALRDNVAGNPHIAMTLLLHRLVSEAFLHSYSNGCLEASIHQAGFPEQSEDLQDCASARAIAERHEAWANDVPKDDQELWDWLTNLDETSRAALLAHCVSYGVNAVHVKPSPYGGSGLSDHALRLRLDQADRLAEATALNMVEAGWRPTVSNYLGRVTKARILQAVSEGVGAKAASRIEHLKKDDMAREAENLLADTGWLPEPLRSAIANDDEAGIAASDSEAIATEDETAASEATGEEVPDDEPSITSPETIAAE